MVDVKALREKLGLSQSEFAACFQLPLRSMQAWEQGQRNPSGSSYTLLQMIEEDPQAVIEILDRIGQKQRPAADVTDQQDACT